MRYCGIRQQRIFCTHDHISKGEGTMKQIRRTAGTVKNTAATVLFRMKRDYVRRRVWKSRKKYSLA